MRLRYAFYKLYADDKIGLKMINSNTERVMFEGWYTTENGYEKALRCLVSHYQART